VFVVRSMRLEFKIAVVVLITLIVGRRLCVWPRLD